jgi:hypothetical protein
MKKVCINAPDDDIPNTTIMMVSSSQHDTQLNELRRIFALQETAVIEKSLLTTALKKKISGYKQQDLVMEQKDGEQQSGYILINLAEVIKKLISCDMKCYYCHCNVLILYKVLKEPLQWTLDRKDNDYGHTDDNTLIACLKCNLSRRVMPFTKFIFTKHLKITKMGDM